MMKKMTTSDTVFRNKYVYGAGGGEKMGWDQEAFGHRLRYLREQLGLSMLAFGREIGTSASRIKHWEEGKSAPTAGWIVKISNRFGVSADLLLLGEQGASDCREPELPQAGVEEEDALDELIRLMKTAGENEFAGGDGKERIIREISSRLPGLSSRDLHELLVLTALKTGAG